MKLNRLEKNFTLQTANQLLTSVMFIFTIPYVTRNLYADNLGYYSYLASICSYFTLVANLGSYSYGVREIAYFQNDRKKYSRVFSEIQLLRTTLSCIALFFYGIYALLYNGDKVILTILALNIVNIVLDISWFYNGIEEFAPVTLRSLIIKILYTICIFAFVRSPDSFYSYVLIQVGYTPLISLSCWFHIRKYVDFTFKVNPFVHLKGSFALFLPALAIQMYTVLDKTMLGIFSTVNYNENAYYDFAQNIVKNCLVLCTSLTTVSAPKISYSIASNDIDGMKQQLYNSYTFVWFSGLPICVTLFAIAPLFVPIYFGPGYDKVAVLIRVLIPMILIIGMSSVSGNQYFVPKNLIKFQTISLISGSLINVILNACFIPRFSSVGASVASVLAELSVTTCQFVFIARYGELKISRILYSSMRYIIGGVVIAFFYFAMISNFAFGGIISIVILVLAGLAIYFAILLLLKDPNVLYYIKRRNIQG